eukprot:COSAG05_NODE_11378_length_516_cov_1.326139_1_plen_106_part_01
MDLVHPPLHHCHCMPDESSAPHAAPPSQWPPQRADSVMLVSIPLLLAVVGRAEAGCLVVHDVSSAQDVRIEDHGTNAVRVRAVPTGGKFLDSPDVISAFTPLPATA